MELRNGVSVTSESSSKRAPAASELPTDAEIVIIGGGVAGLCSGLYLAQAGYEVVVLERGEAWGDASGANAGTLSLQVKRPEVLDLMLKSIGLWEGFLGDLGLDLGYARPGGLRVATTGRECAMLSESVRLQRDRGFEVELLEGNALRAAAPWLGPEVRAASHCPWDAFSSPLLVGPALVRATREAGVQLVEQAEVQGIDPAGNGFLVATALGAVHGGVLVIAAGAWSGEIAAMLGVRLPVMTDVNMLTITEPGPPLLDKVVTHIGGILSLKQYPNGTCMIGGGWQGRGGLESGEKALDYESLLHNLRFAARVVPALAELRIVRSWAGFEGVAPDALPLLGRLPGHDTAYIVACARGGYSMSPAQALLLSELIATGRTSLPVTGFNPGRFCHER